MRSTRRMGSSGVAAFSLSISLALWSTTELAHASGPRSASAPRLAADTLTAMPSAGVKAPLRTHVTTRAGLASDGPAWSAFTTPPRAARGARAGMSRPRAAADLGLGDPRARRGDVGAGSPRRPRATCCTRTSRCSRPAPPTPTSCWWHESRRRRPALGRLRPARGWSRRRRRTDRLRVQARSPIRDRLDRAAERRGRRAARPPRRRRLAGARDRRVARAARVADRARDRTHRRGRAAADRRSRRPGVSRRRAGHDRRRCRRPLSRVSRSRIGRRDRAASAEHVRRHRHLSRPRSLSRARARRHGRAARLRHARRHGSRRRRPPAP